MKKLAKILIKVLLIESVLTVLALFVKIGHFGGSISQGLFILAGVGMVITILLSLVFFGLSLYNTLQSE